MMKIDNYFIDEHIHRFAVWTAARAASKSRLSNLEISKLIESVKLKYAIEELRTIDHLTETVYRNWIFEIGSRMVKTVKATNYPVTKKANFKTDNFTFGIAAKIISIYIKTVEELPSKGESLLSQIAYPPIDSILLKNFNSTHEVKFKTNWSTFGWDEYEAVILRLNNYYPDQPKWKIEVEWKVSNEEDAENQMPN